VSQGRAVQDGKPYKDKNKNNINLEEQDLQYLNGILLNTDKYFRSKIKDSLFSQNKTPLMKSIKRCMKIRAKYMSANVIRAYNCLCPLQQSTMRTRTRTNLLDCRGYNSLGSGGSGKHATGPTSIQSE